MNEQSWRRVVDALLYSVQSQRSLDGDLAAARAKALVAEPIHGSTAAEEYRALDTALRSTAPLAAGPFSAHAEPDVRTFLAAVKDGMDALRPWPTPAFTPLADDEWTRFDGAEPVARIRAGRVAVQERLQRVFGATGEGASRRNVLVLRLRSGDDVALATPWWRGSDDVAVLRAAGSERTPGQVRAAFREATGFRAHEMTDAGDPADGLLRDIGTAATGRSGGHGWRARLDGADQAGPRRQGPDHGTR